MGSSSFEVESVDPLVIQVTRRIPVKEGAPKVEKRRREVRPEDVAFFLRTYKPV